MKRFVGFEHGMGIGGWLTNYKRFNVLPMDRRLCLTVGDMEHFANYITEADVAYIASLGMDHIRLGFDQIVVEESPYVYREEIFAHIDRFVGWCRKHGLNIVLNLHKAIGNYDSIITYQLPWYIDWVKNYWCPLYTGKEITIYPIVIAKKTNDRNHTKNNS